MGYVRGLNIREANNGVYSDMINKSTLEIHCEEGDDGGETGTVYTDVISLAEALPDNQPRFVLLSYPITMVTFARSSPLLISGGASFALSLPR